KPPGRLRASLHTARRARPSRLPVLSRLGALAPSRGACASPWRWCYDRSVPRRLALAALALPFFAATALPCPAARAHEPTPVSWATAQAAQRTKLGREHAAQGEVDAAVRSYLDAIGFDATYGPAYLALGDIQAARGDVAEAERAFSMGID